MRPFFLTLIGFVVLVLSFGVTPSKASLAEIDWGDAPDPSYPTLYANGNAIGGAYHFVSLLPLYLGEGVDGAWYGQTPFADGDLLDDGVVFETPLVIGENASILVSAVGSGYLNAWLDFNLDGDWTDPGENVFIDEALTAGDTQLFLSIPWDAMAGQTYARFRFSSVSGLDFFGEAPDGEVEDYMVEIQNPVPIPNAMVLLGVGMIGLVGIGRRKTN